MKKLVSLLVLVCMLLSIGSVVFAAPEDIDVSKYKLVDEPATLSFISQRGQSTGEPQDQWMWQWLEELTGVTCEVEYVDGTVWSDKKTILMASGDYPDIFFSPSFSTSEIAKFGAEGIFIDLNELVDTYGTNIKWAIEEWVPGTRAAATLPDGSLYTLPYVNKGNLVYSDMRTWINQAWLDKLEMKMPTTLTEFYDVLKAFKEKDPNGNGEADEIPWSGSWENWPKGNGLIFNALGFITGGSNIAVKDNQAVYMPLHEDYKLYLEFMSKLYAEGLIDQDMFTQNTEQYRVKGKAGIIGYSADAAPFLMTAYEEHCFDYQHVLPLTSSVNETPIYFQQNGYSMGFAEISDNCKDPELAIRFLDILYDPYIAYGCLYGPIYYTETMPEDDEWAPFGRYVTKITEEDVAAGKYSEAALGMAVTEAYVPIAKPAWEETEWQTKMRTTVTNPEDLGPWDWYCRYIGPRDKGTGFHMGLDEWSGCYLTYDVDMYAVMNCDPTTLEGAWRSSQVNTVTKYYTQGMPTVWFTEEQQEVINELWTPLEDYVKQMEAKFITGAASLDEYDSFVAELGKLGAEDIQKIYQDATAAFFAAK
ncbi:MAG: hypothetical protein ACOX63_12615 [Christensenellales bacterium]|jgi:ABC-type glycerol-3-phosphate transport system substrate-binding protein